MFLIAIFRLLCRGLCWLPNSANIHLSKPNTQPSAESLIVDPVHHGPPQICVCNDSAEWDSAVSGLEE